MKAVLPHCAPRLGVNIDHVATIRQARKTPYPDVVGIAILLEEHSACDSITVHLREDRRHIQYDDVCAIRQQVDLPLNLEMAPTDLMHQTALEVKPERVCLVPEKRQELTTEGGLAIATHQAHLTSYVRALRDQNIDVSLFIEPNRETIKRAQDIGACAIELHTGEYANASGIAQNNWCEIIRDAACYGTELGLEVHAGHGLTLDNVAPLAAISEIVEFNIGHAIVADALIVGIVAAAKAMQKCLIDART